MSLFALFQFYQEASDYQQPDQAAVTAMDPDGGQHVDYYRRIVGVSCACGAVGFLLGVAVWALALTDGEAVDVKTGKEAMFMLLAPLILAAPGLLFGAALACAVAPRDFLLG